ncbi:MAG: hypothetical protein KAU62_06145 [Candidatus Heimdallarchaeota archaeon]|nr:hypothetical protein [Candidatus Heimdallarchaeota archaeon]MCG3255647.1 hypothetical protein [Candidatus Heimdallarchaeota archaeon]MCK4610722.1 hypothetical protein [Candidatus Heimdallarchaeota archaeon]
MSVKLFRENLSWKNTRFGILFLSISSIVFILAFMFVFAGLSNFLYLLRVAIIPVVVLQILMIVISLALSFSLSFLLSEWILEKKNPFKDDKLSVKHHVFFSILMVITILDVSLFYVNIVAIICATVIFWLGKTRVWRILGFLAISCCLVTQLTIYLLIWR